MDDNNFVINCSQIPYCRCGGCEIRFESMADLMEFVNHNNKKREEALRLLAEEGRDLDVEI